MTTQNRRFGRLPTPPDRRDYPAKSFLPPLTATLPAEYTIPFLPPVLDQSDTSMCADFSIRSLKEAQEQVERGRYEAMASGYVYGNRRETDYQGEGMFTREALRTLLDYGIPPASVFIAMGSYASCRDLYRAHRAAADESARHQRISAYAACSGEQEVMQALYSLKAPVYIGITATASFAWFTRADGMVADEPIGNFQRGSAHWLGGHAMIVVGWRRIDGRLYWIVQNSWGTAWGDGGRCYMPAHWLGIDELWIVTDRRPRGKGVRFKIGQPAVEHLSEDGSQVTRAVKIDTAPFLQSGRTQVPLRAFTDAIAELTGVRVAILPAVDPDGNPVHVDLVLLAEEE